METNLLKRKLSYDYVRGLASGCGSFTFSSNLKIKRRIPAFSLNMHMRDKELLELVRNTLGLRNKIYVYDRQKNNGKHKNQRAILIVREFGQLKNIVVPFFYNKLVGSKSKQFQNWLKKIGDDPMVPKHFKFIYEIYKSGFYDKNQRFIE